MNCASLATDTRLRCRCADHVDMTTTDDRARVGSGGGQTSGCDCQLGIASLFMTARWHGVPRNIASGGQFVQMPRKKTELESRQSHKWSFEAKNESV